MQFRSRLVFEVENIIYVSVKETTAIGIVDSSLVSPYGLFTFTEADPNSDTNVDSNLIPVLGSWDGNQNRTVCSVKISAHQNVTHLVCSLNRNRNPDLAM